MPKFRLTEQQKTTLELSHKKSRAARECDRIKAVFLRLEGWSPSSIAQALRISEFTIFRHLDGYLNKEKLNPESGDSGSHLNDEQSEQLIDHLPNYTYARTC